MKPASVDPAPAPKRSPQTGVQRRTVHAPTDTRSSPVNSYGKCSTRDSLTGRSPTRSASNAAKSPGRESTPDGNETPTTPGANPSTGSYPPSRTSPSRTPRNSWDDPSHT